MSLGISVCLVCLKDLVGDVLDGVTGITYGNEYMMTVKLQKTTVMTLETTPMIPRLNGPRG
jgi:hypothetical protein